MTSIVFISDTHYSHRELKVPKADILVHCGDCMGHGKIEELIDLNDWFGNLPHKFKLACPGIKLKSA